MDDSEDENIGTSIEDDDSVSSGASIADASIATWSSPSSIGYHSGSTMSSIATSVTSEAEMDSDLPEEDKDDLRQSSRKHDKEFHKLFPNVPEDERLVKFYTCALASDILLQGRFFVTSKHIGFHSNIFGWITHKVFKLSDIEAFEPKSTAGIFPNAILVKMRDGERYTFATFVNRDEALALLNKVHRSVVPYLSEPAAQSSPEIDRMSIDDTAPGMRSHKSSISHTGAAPPQNTTTEEDIPQTHAPTKLPPVDEKENVIIDETVEAPMSRVANLLFDKNTEFYHHFLVEVEGNRDLDKIPAFKDKKRYFEYIKPLNGPVGPKETKCKCTETIESWDLYDSASILQATVTPDVPSGNAFTTMTRICLAWAPENKTALRMSTWIDWTGKSWLKGPIEKGAIDGQTSFAQDLVQELHAKLVSGESTSKPVVQAPPKKAKVRKSKKAPPSSSIPVSVLVGTFAVLLLLGAIYLGFCHAKDSHPSRDVHQDSLTLLDQELKLWEWIYDRSAVNAVTRRTMNEKEVEEAIRITEMKLKHLKDALAIPSREGNFI